MELRSRSGQAMIIATLALGGALLGATALAGVLMLYTVRSTTDSANSARAIFAADSGVNWALYYYFHPPIGTPPTLANGATVAITCYDALDAVAPCDGSGVATTSYAISRGLASNARRAFWLDLANATTSPP